MTKVEIIKEFGLKCFVHESARHPSHYRLVSLAAISEGLDPISAKKGDKHLFLPKILHRKFELDRRIRRFDRFQTLQNSLTGPIGGILFSLSSRLRLPGDEMGLPQHAESDSEGDIVVALICVLLPAAICRLL